MRTVVQSFCRCVLIGFTILCAQASNRVPAGEAIVPSGQDLAFTEYDGLRPVVKVHAARVFVDHEKVGFFRFGLAPLAVVQDVQIQIESAGQLTNVLADLNSWNNFPRNLRHLELRNLEISFFGEPKPRLCAVTARVTASGSLELSQVSVRDGVKGSIARATLQLTGALAGDLRWRDGDKESEQSVLQPSEKSSP